jgi:hypothetical protein
MQIIESIKLGNTNYSCPYCKGTDLTKYKVIERVKILFWEVSNEVVEEYVECADCRKRMPFALVNKTPVVVKKDENGTVTRTTTEIINLKSGEIVLTRTVTDTQKYIPNMADSELYVLTLVLILEYIGIKDPTIDIQNKEMYQFLLNKHSQHKTVVANIIEEAEEDENYFKALILMYFRKCQKEYSKSIVQQILRNSADVLKGKLIVHHEIESLYFDLLTEMDIPELTRPSYLLNLIAMPVG